MVLKQSQLSHFIKVAETGQMTLAASALCVPQAALSQSISQLEAEVGAKLLERHPRGISLTPAGATFLEKAKLALAAQADAAATAASLARDLRGMLQIGFLSIPPMLMAPELLEAFAAARPDVEISSRELRFPSCAPSSWLADLDVALCHAPVPDPQLGILALREDPRAVVMPADHRLARRGTLTVEEILGETFYGVHPSVDPDWRSFWNLEKERGGAARVTADEPTNTLEQVAAMATSRAISTLPASVAAIVVDLVPSLVALPLIDAAPAACALVWHRSRPSAVVADLLALAGALAPGAATAGEGRGRRGGSAEPGARARPTGPRAAGLRRKAAVSSRVR
jgi:DNA-binding transcriptional LysR family regulator